MTSNRIKQHYAGMLVGTLLAAGCAGLDTAATPERGATTAPDSGPVISNWGTNNNHQWRTSEGPGKSFGVAGAQVPPEALGGDEPAAIAMALFFASSIPTLSRPQGQHLLTTLAATDCGFCQGMADAAEEGGGQGIDTLKDRLDIDHTTVSTGTSPFIADSDAIYVAFDMRRTVPAAPQSDGNAKTPVRTSDWHMTVWLVPYEGRWQIREVSMRAAAVTFD